MTAVPAALVRALGWLVRPHPSVAQADRRRRCRFLAGVLLAVLAGGTTVLAGYTAMTAAANPPLEDVDFYVSVAALLLLVASYLLNRRGLYGPAVRLAVITTTVAVFAAAIPSGHSGETQLLYYVIVPVVLSSVLLSVRFTAALAATAAAAMAAFGLAVPGAGLGEVPLVSVALMSGVVLLAAEHRRRLELDRGRVLAESEERFRTLVMHAPEAILVYDADEDRLVEANRNAEQLFAVPRERLLRWSIRRLASARQAGKALAEGLSAALAGEEPTFEWVYAPPSEPPITCEVRMVRLQTSGRRLVRGSFTDITQRKQAEGRLRYLATHDAMTGLANRGAFGDRLEEAIARSRRHATGLAVLFLDLDNFKEVNDAFSHGCGDEVLRLIASRLRRVLRDSDTVARRGGDEFSVLVEDLADPMTVVPILEKLLAAVSEPCIIEGRELFLTTSIGVSMYPENGEHGEALIQNADTALYHAKATGKNSYSFFSGEMTRRALRRLSLAVDLRRAVKRGELELRYQPQVDSEDGRVVALEALLRWSRPDPVTPSEFIPIAEESGLITAITPWVLETACRAAVEWTGSSLGQAGVAVNVSERDLRHGQVVQWIEQALERTGLAPERLEIELTENIVFQQMSQSQELLRLIRALGVGLAIDDFGSGFSTLRQLAGLPISTIKIHGGFAPRIVKDRREAAVVAGIMAIGERLGVAVVAEGVENGTQLAAYRRLGCTLVQGYHYSRPVEPQKCTELPRRVAARSGA